MRQLLLSVGRADAVSASNASRSGGRLIGRLTFFRLGLMLRLALRTSPKAAPCADRRGPVPGLPLIVEGVFRAYRDRRGGSGGQLAPVRSCI